MVTATDADGRTGSRSYSVAIAEAPVVIVISPEELPDGEVSERYRATLTAEGGTEPHTFAVTGGTLPPGLSLSSAGAISGRPSEAGEFSFTVTATDADGNTGSRDYAVSIAEAVIIVVSPGSLPEGEVGEAYSEKFHRLGRRRALHLRGRRRARRAAVAAAVAGLPPGLTLSSDGLLSGTPAEAGEFSFTVTATDANGEVGRKSYTLAVAAAPRPDPSLDPEVIGLINAQTETVRRFATTQLSNFSRRLEDLRREGRAGSHHGIRLDTGDSITACPTPEPTEHRPFWEDPCPEEERGQGDGVGASGFAPSDWAVWSEGVIEFGDAEVENSDFDFTTSGVTVGLDYRFSQNFTGGFGLGYGHDESDIGENGTQSDGDALSAALYGSFRPVPAIFLEAVLGYAALSFDNTRFVTETGGFAQGERDGDQVFGSLGGGYQFLKGPLALSPYARFDLAWARLDAYTENGGDEFALHYDEADVGLVNSVLGLKAEYDLAMGWGLLVPNMRAEWRQDLSGSEDAEIAYADALSETFAVESDAASESSVLFGLGLDALLDQGFSLGLAYEASLARRATPTRACACRASKRF